MNQNENKVDDILAHAFGIRTDSNLRPSALSDTERRAYQAAWRIDRERLPESVNGLACQSARHARYIDNMARIIQEEMGQ